MPKAEQQEHLQLRREIIATLRNHNVKILPIAGNDIVLRQIGIAFSFPAKEVMDAEYRHLKQVEKFRLLVLLALAQAAKKHDLKLDLPNEATADEIVAALKSLLAQRKRT